MASTTAEQLRRVCRRVRPVTSRVPFDAVRLEDGRRAHQRGVVRFLDPLIPLGAPLLPRAEQFVDYIPWIGEMVRSDDAQEAAGPAFQRTRSGRAVRGGHTSYVRYISVEDEEGLRAARAGLGQG